MGMRAAYDALSQPARDEAAELPVQQSWSLQPQHVPQPSPGQPRIVPASWQPRHRQHQRPQPSPCPETRLFKEFISSSAEANIFSFSSSWMETRTNLSLVRSSSVSSCLALVISSSTSSSALLARSLAALQASSHLSTLSQALSFSTFMACIFFLMASISLLESLEDERSRLAGGRLPM